MAERQPHHARENHTQSIRSTGVKRRREGRDRFTTASWCRSAMISRCGIRVVLTPVRAPNANAYAERFVRSIKEECLDRMIPLGERHFRRSVAQFVEHYHRERNHQGLHNRLLLGTPATDSTGRVRRRPRLGGLLNFYERAA